MNTPVITDKEHLDDLLSLPSERAIEAMSRVQGDIIVLGAAGKMGPSLTRMIQRADDANGTKRRLIAVSRFSSQASRAEFEAHNIETIKCDLMDQAQLASLPEAPNLVYMAGMKFGSTGNEALTWAMNTYLPGMVCSKYRNSKIVAFSTGNVYPLTPLRGGGAKETDPTAPVGDYAMSCLGRERIFEHYSRQWAMPISILRLNYAIAIRYGVLVDVAKKVWNGEAVCVEMGAANVIWQGDANAMALQSFDHAASPPFVVNIAGSEQISIRETAHRFGELMGKSPVIDGEESSLALLSDAQCAVGLFGYPRVGVEQMIVWVANWVMSDGEYLGKPTHFEVRDGRF